MKTQLFSAALAAALCLLLTAKADGDTPYRPGAPVPAPTAPASVQPMMPGGRATVLPLGSTNYIRHPFTFDIRGFYGFRAVPHSTLATDMAGMEAEFAWYVTPRQAVTLSASFGSGGNDAVNVIETPHGFVPVSEDYTRSDVTVILGSRFTPALTPRTTLSFGLKGGLDIQRLTYDDFWGKYYDGYHGWYGYDDYYYDDHSYGKSTCGFAYAASVMLETRITRQVMLQFGYQFRGATTQPKVPCVVPGGPYDSAHAMRWHELHLGLRVVF